MLSHAVLGLVALLLPSQAEQPAQLFKAGIGVIGDSYSDEYQFHADACRAARNWVEILAELRGLDFGALSLESRGEPRRQGFSYNWARADATSSQAVETGQHVGLAAQAAAGQVQIAQIFIGGNDFLNALLSREPIPRIEQALAQATSNLDLMIRALQEATPDLTLILVTVPDVRHLPEIASYLREGRLTESAARACSRAIASYDAHIRAITVKDPRILLIDFDLASRFLLGLGADSIPFGDGRLDAVHPGNDPDHLFLTDGRHPGTLAQGIFAQMFVECLRAGIDAPIASLRPAEVKEFAASLPETSKPSK